MADIRKTPFTGIGSDADVYYREQSREVQEEFTRVIADESSCRMKIEAASRKMPPCVVQWEKDGKPQVKKNVNGDIYYSGKFGIVNMPRVAEKYVI